MARRVFTPPAQTEQQRRNEVADALHVLASRVQIMANDARKGRWVKPHLEYEFKNGDTLKVDVRYRKVKA